MELITVIIFGLALGGSECHFGIIEETSISDKSARITEVAVKTLLSCYEKEVNTVGAAGISERIPYKVLLSKLSLPVTLVGDDTARASVNNETVDKKSRHKLQLFVVEASSSEQLDRILLRVKTSLWWNHMATYLILDQQSQKRPGCLNAFEYLWTAWKRNLLNALYICLDDVKEKALVYSYNPYTSKAPAPWQLANTYKGKNDHPWAMFVREYRPGEVEICNNLNFVKTNDLGGYGIDCSIRIPDRSIDVNKIGLDVIYRKYAYAANILKALKVTPSLVMYSLNATPGWANKRGRDIAMDTVDGISDMLLNTRYDQLVSNFTFSSTIINSGLGVLTQYRGQMSQLDKILAVLDRSTRFGLCLVAVKTLLFFKYFVRQPLGSAILNVLRIICNSSLVKVPKKVGPRLYLAGVFILVVTIVGIYQGKMASLLTKPIPLPDVETMQDLIESSHKIHGHKSYAHFFEDPIFKNRFVRHNSFGCTDYLVADSSAACVKTRGLYVKKASDLNLHLSRDTIVAMNAVYVIREDWPLEDRLNAIIRAFGESYIDWYEILRHRQWTSEAIQYNADLEANGPNKAINLSEIGFAFAILGIGLGLATVAFIVEVAIN